MIYFQSKDRHFHIISDSNMVTLKMKWQMGDAI